MLCKDAEELIKKYKAGSITADNFLLLVSHIKECSKCKALFDRVEASLGNIAKKNLFTTIYNNFLEWCERKYSEKKIYTKRNFYTSVVFIIGILLYILSILNKSYTFNTFFIILASFIGFIAILIFFIVYLVKE
ncbi:MAG TPA: hypothetical protein PKW55_00455 [Spirochaetota bacterium]|nr:hypothetical protein [Spirochaetota bacterium]HOM37826.1 hypothetical protein [Spirochaetota bacterium]HPQ49297.1 hypothetical protein [Spirochaetota bacterium]